MAAGASIDYPEVRDLVAGIMRDGADGVAFPEGVREAAKAIRDDGAGDEMEYEISAHLAPGGKWPHGPWLSDDYPDRQFILIPEDDS